MEKDRKHLKQLRDKWKAQPVSFVEQALGKQVWEKQADILHSVRDHKRTSVRSGNTCGKNGERGVRCTVVFVNHQGQHRHCHLTNASPNA